MKLWDKCFNELPDIILQFDRNGRVIKSNNAAEKTLCNESRAVLNGLTCREIIHNVIVPESGCPICKLLVQRTASEWIGQAKGLDARYHVTAIPGNTKDDGGMFFARRLPPLLSSDTTASSLSMIDQKKVRAIIAEGLLRALENIEMGIHVIDLDSYEILWANEFKKRQFGRHIVGQGCHHAISETGVPCADCTNDKLVIDGVIQQAVSIVRLDPLANDECLFINKASEWPDGRFVKIEFVADLFGRNQKDNVIKAEVNEKLAEGSVDSTQPSTNNVEKERLKV
jgi:hypothetical protein